MQAATEDKLEGGGGPCLQRGQSGKCQRWGSWSLSPDHHDEDHDEDQDADHDDDRDEDQDADHDDTTMIKILNVMLVLDIITSSFKPIRQPKILARSL